MKELGCLGAANGKPVAFSAQILLRRKRHIRLPIEADPTEADPTSMYR